MQGVAMKKIVGFLISLGVLLSTGAFSQSGGDCQQQLNCKSSWVGTSTEQRAEIFAFAEQYKDFIHKARTELSFVSEAIALAEANGFVPLTDLVNLRAGTRVYEVNRDRAISLMVIGSRPMAEGFHVIGAHIDSPRLELKARPVFENSEFALLQTNFHGGIKFHQWTNLPLALLGRVDRLDGTVVSISIGLEADEPIFMIPELSPHVDRSRGSQTLDNFIVAEDLDPVVGHLPDLVEGGKLQQQVLNYLAETYGISPADLVSAELSLVPAERPRDMGFDRALIAAYGQDDRLAAYTILRAITELERPLYTAVAYLVDNEEVGNRNNTGAGSSYYADLLSRLLLAELGIDYRETAMRSAMRKTRFISIDVNPGINPFDPGVWEPGNAPKLGYGINLKLYGQGNNANSEFIAWTRRVLEENDIPWQTATYKVGVGSGGTIGGEFSAQNNEVIDIGVPLLSIHTPYSVSSKIDVFNLYRAAVAFYQHQE
jgi:aspartyl aminopeptidase